MWPSIDHVHIAKDVGIALLSLEVQGRVIALAKSVGHETPPITCLHDILVRWSHPKKPQERLRANDRRDVADPG